MVNGKPNLTFGGADGISPLPARQARSAFAPRNAEPFASYLPGANYAKAVGQTPAETVRQGLAAGSASLQGGQSIVPQAYGMRNDRPYQPAGYASAWSPANAPIAPAGARNAGLMPAGSNPYGQARMQARPRHEGMMSSFGSINAQGRHLSSKTAPRISGRPITGRRNIGMTDTRKTPVESSLRSAQLSRSSKPFVSRQNPLAPPGSDQYSRFSAYAGAQHAPGIDQGFLSQGFSGKHAEKAMKNLGYDVKRRPAVHTQASLLDADPYALGGRDNGVTYGLTHLSREQGEDAARMAVITASHRKRASVLPTGSYPGRSLVQPYYDMAGDALGILAAKFESGSDGIAAIGYDRNGGTSYGKYQIASRVGTMKAFLEYLRENAPDIGSRLASAGPANTGGRKGRMPDEWRRIAAEDPQRFEALQSDFIKVTHFEPAMDAVASSTGVTFDSLPSALQEVLFSTAVQHGPAGASRIINQALNQVGPEKLMRDAKDGKISRKTGEHLITSIYRLRASQFMSSTSQVQAAARSRMRREMQDALAMLS